MPNSGVSYAPGVSAALYAALQATNAQLEAVFDTGKALIRAFLPGAAAEDRAVSDALVAAAYAALKEEPGSNALSDDDLLFNIINNAYLGIAPLLGEAPSASAQVAIEVLAAVSRNARILHQLRDCAPC